MKFSNDAKTLLIGILTGVLLTLVMGQAVSGAGRADFAIALENNGMALVRANDGVLYVINPETGRSEIVQYRDGPHKGSAFNLTKSLTRKSSK